jgi:hypothetical protein
MLDPVCTSTVLSWARPAADSTDITAKDAARQQLRLDRTQSSPSS